MRNLAPRVVSIDEPLLKRLHDACTQVLRDSNNNLLLLLRGIDSIQRDIRVEQFYQLTFKIEWQKRDNCFFVSVHGALHGLNGRTGFTYADSSGNETFLFYVVAVNHLMDLYEATLDEIKSEEIVTVTVTNN
jgi:hypothetical protein